MREPEADGLKSSEFGAPVQQAKAQAKGIGTMSGAPRTRRLAEQRQPANHKAWFSPHSQLGEAGFVWRAQKGAELGSQGLPLFQKQPNPDHSSFACSRLSGSAHSAATRRRGILRRCREPSPWTLHTQYAVGLLMELHPPADTWLSISTVSSASTDLRANNRRLMDLKLVAQGSVNSGEPQC